MIVPKSATVIGQKYKIVECDNRPTNCNECRPCGIGLVVIRKTSHHWERVTGEPISVFNNDTLVSFNDSSFGTYKQRLLSQ